MINVDDDDLDDDPDAEDEDLDDDDDDDDEDDDEDIETWQVSEAILALKVTLYLTSGAQLPRLTRIFQLRKRWTDSAGLASRRLAYIRRRS